MYIFIRNNVFPIITTLLFNMTKCNAQLEFATSKLH